MLPRSSKTEKKFVELLPDQEGAENSGLFAESFFMYNCMNDLRQHSQALFKEAGAIAGSGPVKPYNRLRDAFVIEGIRKTSLSVLP